MKQGMADKNTGCRKENRDMQWKQTPKNQDTKKE